MKAKLTTPPPQCYWHGTGRYQKLGDKLQKLVPSQGEVKNKDKNPCLELCRRATNCYYDLFNNGLGNRSKEFYQIFKFSPFKVFPQIWGGFDGLDFKGIQVDGRVDRHMDKLIYSAALEQGLVKHPN